MSKTNRPTTAPKPKGQPETEPPSVTLADLGGTMLACGYAVTDVRVSLNQIAGRSDLSGISVQVEPDTVFVDDAAAGTMRMTIAPEDQFSLEQVGVVATLVSALTKGQATLEDAAARLRDVRASTHTEPWLLASLGGGMICAAITVLFTSPWWSVVVSFTLGLLIGALLQVVPAAWQTNGTFAFILALLTGLAIWGVASLIGVHSLPTFALCGPLVMLVPGRLVTNAVLEISGGDPISGGGRLASGLLVWAMLAAGILVAVQLTGSKFVAGSLILKTGTKETQAALGIWGATPTLATKWVAVFFIAAGFALVYQSTMRMFVAVTITLYFAFAVLHASETVVSPVIAGGVAAALTLFISRIPVGVGARWPSIVLFRPAFYMLVPGSLGLVMVLELASKNSTPNAALSLLGSVMALTIGIQVGAAMAQIVTSVGAHIRARIRDSSKAASL